MYIDDIFENYFKNNISKYRSNKNITNGNKLSKSEEKIGYYVKLVRELD